MVHKLVPDVELSNEYKLLILCARTRMTEEIEKKIKSLVWKDIDWDYLLKQSTKHRLTPLLYWQLNSVCPDSVPLEIMGRLKTHFDENARRNLLFMGELQKILDLFEAHGIDAIPYKGPLMAISTYNKLVLREFSDLDIFVNRKDVLKVKEILFSLGYKTKLKLSKERELQYLKLQREYQFINDDGVSVDIQWNLADISLSFPNEPVFTMDKIKSESTEINNKVISSFLDEDLLIILSLHTVTHLWGKLAWICDIAELIKNSHNGLNWDEIIKKSQYLAVKRIVYLNLSLAIELFDVELPNVVINKIKSDDQIKPLKQNVKIIISADHSFVRSFSLRFKIREKLENRLEDFFKIVLIPTSTEWKSFQKSRPLALSYVLNRPIQILNKAIK